MIADEEFDESIRYRLAYGHAAELAEEHERSRGWASEAFRRIVAQVAERLACDPEDETVRDAVRDAIEGRRPRW